jgi:hypothetical protein
MHQTCIIFICLHMMDIVWNFILYRQNIREHLLLVRIALNILFSCFREYKYIVVATYVVYSL